MNQLIIAKTKKILGFKFIVAPKSKYCQNYYFKQLDLAGRCFAGFHEGTVELMTIDEYIEKEEKCLLAASTA